MARKTLRRLVERSIGSEWDRVVRRVRAGRKRHVLVCWNRGLGDVALGVYPLLEEMRRAVPDVSISVLTRAELADAFLLVGVDELIVDPSLHRRDTIVAKESLQRLGINPRRFDEILKRPDPTHWLRDAPKGQPRLQWPAHCNRLSDRFDDAFAMRGPRPVDIGIHLQSETMGFYRYRKDWPIDAWRALFADLALRHDVRFVIFGLGADPLFEGPAFVDLRGRTSLLEMLALIKNRCRMLIAPDSGVLTMTYYLDVQTPIDVISLWADPRQGILKQGAPSPNPLLRHRALVAPGEKIETLAVETVARAVDEMLGPDADAAVAPAEDACSLGAR